MSLSTSQIKSYMCNIKDYDLHSTESRSPGITPEKYIFSKDGMLCVVTEHNKFSFTYYTNKGVISLTSTLYSDIRRVDFDGLEKAFRFYVNAIKAGGDPW